MVQNSRIIGGIDTASAEMAQEFYRSFVAGELYITDATTAEMVKVMENAYRDVNLAFANEMAGVAEALGVDVWRAIELANKHPRVNILKPGLGVGGHCVPVDPWFLAQTVPEKASMIRSARRLNDGVPRHVLSILKKELANIQKPTISLLGLAYKGNVDDTRNSPAIAVADEVTSHGWEVRAYDPLVGSNSQFNGRLASLEQSLQDSHCILLMTDHDQFLNLDVVKIAPRMRHRLVVDTRNFLDHSAWRQAGFRVVVLGVGEDAEVRENLPKSRVMERAECETSELIPVSPDVG